MNLYSALSYHDDAKGKKKGPNLLHPIEDGETRAAPFDDIGCGLDAAQAERLKGLDVALIPVGGFFTIDGRQALALQPKNPA